MLQNFVGILKKRVYWLEQLKQKRATVIIQKQLMCSNDIVYSREIEFRQVGEYLFECVNLLLFRPIKTEGQTSHFLSIKTRINWY